MLLSVILTAMLLSGQCTGTLGPRVSPWTCMVLENINKGVAKKARTHCGLLPFLHTLVFIDASARTPLATMMPRHRPGPGPNLTKHVRICTNAVRSLGRRDIVSIVTNFR